MHDENSETMRWLVGIDARSLSGGAVTFGRWLSGGRFNTVYGVHVVEWVPALQESLDQARPAEVRQRASEALEPLAGDDHFVELGAMLSTAAEDGLCDAVEAKHAHALVIGRRAPQDGGGMVRLGRVARRILRRLPVPVVVVPPDLERVGAGPVVLGVDLTDSCGDAAMVAARIAASMGRSLVLVHAVHPPDRGPYLPADVWNLSITGLHDRSEAGFTSWADRHAVGSTERLTVEGSPVRVLADVAEERDACLLVTGSRGLGGVERLFLSSLGSELAGITPRPVAVVRPHELS